VPAPAPDPRSASTGFVSTRAACCAPSCPGGHRLRADLMTTGLTNRPPDVGLRTTRAWARGGHPRALTCPSLGPSRPRRRRPCPHRAPTSGRPGPASRQRVPAPPRSRGPGRCLGGPAPGLGRRWPRLPPSRPRAPRPRPAPSRGYGPRSRLWCGDRSQYDDLRICRDAGGVRHSYGESTGPAVQRNGAATHRSRDP
jgi:hypothetical protein